jgi:hypothetical protein
MKTPSIEYQILLAASNIAPCQEQRRKLLGLIEPVQYLFY